MANICLIDDEKALNQVLKIYLERDGHSVVPYYCIQDIYKRTTGTRCMIFILLILCFQMAVAPNC